MPMLNTLLAAATITISADTLPKWELFGHPAYITSSFSENRGTRYHAGIDWSTEMQEGWPVLAPEDGSVERIRQSPFSYGKNLMFRGKSSQVYLFAHLSGFAPRMDSLAEQDKLKKSTNDIDIYPSGSITEFRRGDTLAFSGSTGIGNPHLHMEFRDSTTTQVFDPCEHGIACDDTIAPQILGAAVWDASGASPTLSLTSAQALEQGCLEVDPSIREPRIALKIVDYSREPKENPMSVKEITLSDKNSVLFSKGYRFQTYGKMGRIREELLWSEEGNTPGDWHILAKGMDTNENIHVSQMRALSKILRQSVQEKHPTSNLLTLSVRDFRNPPKIWSLKPQAVCTIPNDTTYPGFVSFQDSTVFTFLSRAWLHTHACSQNQNLSLHTEKNKTLVKDLCKELPADRPVSFGYIAQKWPKAKVLEIIKDSTTLRRIHMQSIPAKIKAPLQWSMDSVSLVLNPYSTTYPNAILWEKVPSFVDKDTTGSTVWVFHPKGLHIHGNVDVCIASQDSLARMYWLGETSRLWFLFSKQQAQKSSSGLRQVCASPDELRDLTFHVDTLPPQLGIPRDTLAMVRGKPEPVVRIPVKEPWAGIPNGNAIEGRVNGKWIPLEFDSEPSEIVVERKWWNPGQKLQLTVSDELGNKTTVQLP